MKVQPFMLDAACVFGCLGMRLTQNNTGQAASTGKPQAGSGACVDVDVRDYWERRRRGVAVPESIN